MVFEEAQWKEVIMSLQFTHYLDYGIKLEYHVSMTSSEIDRPLRAKEIITYVK